MNSSLRACPVIPSFGAQRSSAVTVMLDGPKRGCVSRTTQSLPAGPLNSRERQRQKPDIDLDKRFIGLLWRGRYLGSYSFSSGVITLMVDAFSPT